MTQENHPPPLIPLIDPTANVLSLVAAAVLRQDDLRHSAQELTNERVKRLDELRILTERCTQEIAEVHLKGNADLAIAETKRIDALLLAAKADVALASEKASAQAATLATTVATSAEALRGQVSTLASQIAGQTAQMREALEKRLTLLEQSQYAIGGRDIQRGESQKSDQTMIALAITLGLGLIAAAIGVAGVLVRVFA